MEEEKSILEQELRGLRDELSRLRDGWGRLREGVRGFGELAATNSGKGRSTNHIGSPKEVSEERILRREASGLKGRAVSENIL